jgi:hypothetical protein
MKSIPEDNHVPIVDIRRLDNAYRGWTGGHPFMIHGGIVWEVLDDAGIRKGQAALFWPNAAPAGRLDQ